MNDAAETAAVLLHDRAHGALPRGGEGGAAVRQQLASQDAAVVASGHSDSPSFGEAVTEDGGHFSRRSTSMAGVASTRRRCGVARRRARYGKKSSRSTV